MPLPKLYDSHLHLADPRLGPYLAQIAPDYHAIGLSHAVVVGTSPEDWSRVVQICQSDPRYLPAIGLHPWQVHEAPADWKDRFRQHIDSGVEIIGEVGLDQWVEGYDIEKQIEAFRFQFEVAAQCNLPTSIHCLKAHEPLLRLLKEISIPERGFKLHAYNGPCDTITKFLNYGAYFSFNAGQLKPNATRVREIITSVPKDRLLIETDAPDFSPIDEFRAFDLLDETAKLNHPANLAASYEAVASLRNQRLGDLERDVHENFERYFRS